MTTAVNYSVATLATDRVSPVWQHLLMGKGAPNHLKEWREAYGWTLEKLGEGMGTDKTQVLRLETGARRFTVQWLHKAAAAFKRPVEDMLKAPPENLNLNESPTNPGQYAGVTVDEIAMSPEEIDLIRIYRRLGSEGRAHILNSAKGQLAMTVAAQQAEGRPFMAPKSSA